MRWVEQPLHRSRAMALIPSQVLVCPLVFVGYWLHKPILSGVYNSVCVGRGGRFYRCGSLWRTSLTGRWDKRSCVRTDALGIRRRGAPSHYACRCLALSAIWEIDSLLRCAEIHVTPEILAVGAQRMTAPAVSDRSTAHAGAKK